MAGTVRIGTAGIDTRSLQQDLESVQVGLGRQVGDMMLAASVPVVRAARGLTPFDPLHRADRKDHLGHIRDSLSLIKRGPQTAAVVSSHPGAVVHEYGGQIAPRGTPITIKSALMAHRAADQQQAAIERYVATGVDRLMRQHGL
jgi:hypothetical protein